jgi:hypothetical protein
MRQQRIQRHQKIQIETVKAHGLLLVLLLADQNGTQSAPTKSLRESRTKTFFPDGTAVKAAALLAARLDRALQLCMPRMAGIDTFDLAAVDRAPIVAPSDNGCGRRERWTGNRNEQRRTQGEERWRR